MLEMNWTHALKAKDLYHTSSPELEPTGKEKVRPPKKHLAPRSRGQRGWVTPGDNLRGWPRVGMPGEILLVAYTPEGTKGSDDVDDDDDIRFKCGLDLVEKNTQLQNFSAVF